MEQILLNLVFHFQTIADGPTIQMASTESLNSGTKINNFFSIVKKIKKESDIPLVLMTYTNILYNQTYEKFILRAKQAGIDGLILPDMAIEESKEYVKAAKKVGMDTIFLVSPNTEKDRLKQIIKSTSGFLYMVAVLVPLEFKLKFTNIQLTLLKIQKMLQKENSSRCRIWNFYRQRCPKIRIIRSRCGNCRQCQHKDY